MKKSIKRLSRRDFLGQASCAGLGYLTFMNTFMNLKAMNAAAISNSIIGAEGDYKAIVCILKAGGNDSWNMLVPYDSDNYDEYAATRSSIALDHADLLPLTLKNVHPQGREFGVHPSMGGIQELFNQEKAAFLTNVGTLVRPTTLTDYENGFMLPKGLFSHSDQIQEWQTSIPNERGAIGWGGRVADLIMDQNMNDNISMNISLSGSNIFQSGSTAIPYAISKSSGSVGINNYDPESGSSYTKSRTKAVDGLVAQQYANMFDKTYMSVVGNSIDAHLEFQAALEGSVMYDDLFFPNSSLGDSLEMIARVIDIREDLGFSRQIFFVLAGGWDHHSELLNTQSGMLGDVSSSVKSFVDALEDMEMADSVLTMNISEFGRTLTWNGAGTDHAWGGNVWVAGGPNLINGGLVHGDSPSLDLEDNNLNTSSRGRLIPQISTDEYYSEIARWFGVPHTDLSYVFPNINNFFNPILEGENYHPLGFINSY